MSRRVFAGVTVLLLGVVAPQACKPVLIAHEKENGPWPLRGKHQGAACEQCHGALEQGCLGTKKPEPQSTSCVDCHSGDVPEGGPHYPNQECFPCHVEDGWDVGVTPADTDTGTIPPDTDTGTIPPITDTGPVHEPVAPDELCWKCHEDERPGPPTHAEHWINVPLQDNAWDCAPCHTTEAWLEVTPFVDPQHPIRIPHGTASHLQPTIPQNWVISCSPCHTTDPPTKEFQCTESCHLTQVFDNATDLHYQVYPWDPQTRCYDGCHDYGDYE